MKKILYIFLMTIIVQFVWGESPRIVQPGEETTISKNNLFIFVEPTPQDIQNETYLDIEIYHRKSGKLVNKRLISVSNNYKVNISVVDWENGKYLMKVVYANKKGQHLTKATWRNFSIQKQL